MYFKTRKLGTLCVLIYLLIFLSICNRANAQMPASNEHRIKAAFIYNFAKFVMWPDGALKDSDSFIVCILGDDILASSIKQLEGKVVKGKRVAVKHAKANEEISPCHIVFVGRSFQDRLDDILSRLKGQNVMTVGDMDNFARQGGMINFLMKGRKVRFEINPQAARAAGLKVSSKLLSLALVVEPSKL